VALPEEVVKWVVAILTLPVVTSGKRGRGAYLLHGATVAIAFALVGMVATERPIDQLTIQPFV
jgi:hypothetical protein